MRPTTQVWERDHESDGSYIREKYSIMTYERDQGSASSAPESDILTLSKDQAAANDKCEPYKPPAPGVPPPLPEISKDDQRDPDRVGNIFVSHIEKLRDYMAERRRLNEAAYLDYLKKCKTPDATK
jgi:hypothetical protein